MTTATRLDAAGQARAVEHLHLVGILARWAARRNRDIPITELLSAAGYGLCDAAARFDPARNDNFAAYARMVMRCRIMNAVDAWRRWQAIPDDHPDYVIDNRERSPSADLAAREACAEVRGVLTAREYQCLWFRDGEGEDLPAIGRRLGISPVQVHRDAARGMVKARRALAGGLGRVGIA